MKTVVRVVIKNTRETRHYYDIWYSEYLGQHIKTDSDEYVYIESIDDYVCCDDVVFLGYRDLDELAENCTKIGEVWVHEDDTERCEGRLIPKAGICEELDELRQSKLVEIADELEVDVSELEID